MPECNHQGLLSGLSHYILGNCPLRPPHLCAEIRKPIALGKIQKYLFFFFSHSKGASEQVRSFFDPLELESFPDHRSNQLLKKNVAKFIFLKKIQFKSIYGSL